MSDNYEKSSSRVRFDGSVLRFHAYSTKFKAQAADRKYLGTSLEPFMGLSFWPIYILETYLAGARVR